MEALRDQGDGAESDEPALRLFPWREHVESSSLRRLLGDLTGRSVLDLGCGTGLFTRAIRRWGAARVLGIDASEDRIRVARAHESATPLGVGYMVGEPAALGDLGRFDAVVAFALLGVAETREDLAAIGRSAARNLEPGGRLLACLVSPEICRTPGYYRKYGMDVAFDAAAAEGERIRVTIVFGQSEARQRHYTRWSRETVAAALADAGLGALRWSAPEISEQGRERHGDGFWADALRVPPCLFVEARRG
jgi:SAM-dependent methyltransferase